jgi:SAM-dependent methyltransferase
VHGYPTDGGNVKGRYTDIIRKGQAYGRGLTTLLFDPREVVRKYRALPHFFRNASRYRELNADPAFSLELVELWYRSSDRYSTGGDASGHYFFQDLWAAQDLFARGVASHVDVGSRIDGFVAHVLPFCSVTYVDIRPVPLEWPGFHFRMGSITELPFDDDSVASLSCLHVIEHIGLGRYGDTVAPAAWRDAARELARVLAPGGQLLLSTPVGRQRLCFDAHRVFDPSSIADAFAGLDLLEFLLIDDGGEGIRPATFDQARKCEYGCGLFRFGKPAS